MDENELTQQFCDLTGAAPSEAGRYLEGHSWNLESAVNDYFLSQDEDAHPAGASSSAAPASAEYAGPRTLDGKPVPQDAHVSSSAVSGKKPQKKTGLATLGSIGAHNDDDDEDDGDDDEDDDDKKRGDLFAGGEKSGLAVQDPNTQSTGGHKKIIKDLLSRARENTERPESSQTSSSSRAPHFRGTGHTLGGDGIPSRSVPDPRGPPPSRTEMQRQTERQEFVLHIWEDGFSIDDGELRRYDDPSNRADLEMIRSGRAPLHLMDIRMDQPCDVKLETHDEKWKQLPKKYKPFGGSGHRLGSPVPGTGPSGTVPESTVAASATAPGSSVPVSQSESAVDTNQPTVNIRIQLPDGSRLPSQFNTTQTIEDVQDFLRHTSSSLSARSWVLATNFPYKEHTDGSLVLGDMPEFKRGGTAIVKWT